jgi:hypothetical protein
MVNQAITRVFKEPEFSDLRDADKLAHLPRIAQLVHTPTVDDLETARYLNHEDTATVVRYVIGSNRE